MVYGFAPKMSKSPKMLQNVPKHTIFNLCQAYTPRRGQKVGPNAISNQLDSPKGIGNRTWRTVLDFFGNQYLAPLLGGGGGPPLRPIVAPLHPTPCSSTLYIKN